MPSLSLPLFRSLSLSLHPAYRNEVYALHLSVQSGLGKERRIVIAGRHRRRRCLFVVVAVVAFGNAPGSYRSTGQARCVRRNYNLK